MLGFYFAYLDMLISHVRKEVSHSDRLFVCKLKTNPQTLLGYIEVQLQLVCIVSDHLGVNFVTMVRANREAATLPKQLTIVISVLACVAGAWKQRAKERTGAREGDTQGVSRAHVFSCAHYFQAPATQAISVLTIECFHMTSRRPYWCPKTMKRRPCWCPKPILWELNSFLMQTLSFVPKHLHRCWARE